MGLAYVAPVIALRFAGTRRGRVLFVARVVARAVGITEPLRMLR